MNFIDPQIIRTDFSDDLKWNQFCELVNTPNDEFGVQAHIEFVNDPNLNTLDSKQVLETLSEKYLDYFDFFFIADKITFKNKDFPLLCLNIPNEDSPKQDSFRVIPSAVSSVESNLRILNMDFDEFSQNVNKSGVFTGFE